MRALAPEVRFLSSLWKPIILLSATRSAAELPFSRQLERRAPSPGLLETPICIELHDTDSEMEQTILRNLTLPAASIEHRTMKGGEVLIMAIEKIFAHVSCLNMDRSKQWYAKLFGRAADAEPMARLAEWHHGSDAGMQLFEDKTSAGKSTLTLIVKGLAEEHERLTSRGLSPGAVEGGEKISILRMNDPDGNLVVLAQPGRV
jgi:hypothetical protein